MRRALALAGFGAAIGATVAALTVTQYSIQAS